MENRLYNSNNRSVICEDGYVEQVTNYYPFGEVFSTNEAAYAKSPDAQPYKYNGKELDRTHGLDWYDYGARQHDPFVPGFTSLDPLCEKYYHISPYAYYGNNPVNYIDLHGDSITIDTKAILAIYNGLEAGCNIHMKVNNGVLDPSSISDAVSSSNDTFLQDLYEIAVNPQMVDLRTTKESDYIMNGERKIDQWGEPVDIDYAKEYNNGIASDLYPAGKTICGNFGQSLYPINSNELKKSATNHITIYINDKGTINQRSCAIAHEFGHVVLYMRGLPHSHSGNADFIFERQWNVMKRFGYDYLESLTGKIFK